MESRERPSLAIRIFTPLIFIIGSAAALFWFFYRTYCLFGRNLTEIVVFDKGSFYMLGVGGGLAVLSFVTIQEGWLNRPLSKSQSKLLTKLAILSIVLVFMLPHIVHYVANNYLQNQGYSVCEKASHRWLFVRDIVYIQDSVTCSENLKIVK